MRVYRMESKMTYNGIIEPIWWGAFCSKHLTYPPDAIYSNMGCTIPEYNSKYRFACRSIEKVIEYFGSDFARIIGNEDIQLVEYEVKRTHVIFSKKRVELVFNINEVTYKRRIL
jgi:hypothetical protein